MGWIYITDENGGTFGLEATPDPQAMITLDEINAQILELQGIIESIPVFNVPVSFPEDIRQFGEEFKLLLDEFSFDMTNQLNILLVLKAELEALVEG